MKRYLAVTFVSVQSLQFLNITKPKRFGESIHLHFCSYDGEDEIIFRNCKIVCIPSAMQRNIYNMRRSCSQVNYKEQRTFKVKHQNFEEQVLSYEPSNIGTCHLRK